MKRVIRNIIIMIYAIIAIFVTVCLLSYNEYKVTMFGKDSWLIIDNDKLSPEYNKGDLVIVDGDKDILEGDKIFFYIASEGEMTISLAEVAKKEIITDTETTYTLEGERPISSSYVIGSSKDVTVIGTVGTILGILQSQWGFLLLIVLPALLAFLHEIIEVISEIRGNKNSGKDLRNRRSSANNRVASTRRVRTNDESEMKDE